MNNYRKSAISLAPRVVFNPANRKHLKEYALFVKTKNWQNGCNFLLEDPYTDIPSMINEKVVFHLLKPLMKNDNNPTPK